MGARWVAGTLDLQPGICTDQIITLLVGASGGYLIPAAPGRCRSIRVDQRWAEMQYDWWISYTDLASVNSCTNEIINDYYFRKIKSFKQNHIKNNKHGKCRDILKVAIKGPQYMPKEFYSNANKVKAHLFKSGKIEREDYENVVRAVDNIHPNNECFRYNLNKNRLYISGISLQNIKSEYRRLLTPKSLGFFELDLKSAHLSILATIANNATMQAYLDPSSALYVPDIAAHLAAITGLTRREIKQRITPCVYCQPHQVDHFLLNGNKRLTLSDEKLLAHPFITALKEAKQTVIDLTNSSQLKDVWGNTIQGKFEHALHEVCNSYEIEMISPIYDPTLRSRGKYNIVLHQHDGCTLHFTKTENEHVNTVINYLSSRVKKRAKQLGIHTDLVVKN